MPVIVHGRFGEGPQLRFGVHGEFLVAKPSHDGPKRDRIELPLPRAAFARSRRPSIASTRSRSAPPVSPPSAVLRAHVRRFGRA